MLGLTDHVAFSTLALLLGWLINLALVPSIINARKPAVSAIAWLMAMVLLPYAGALLYMVIGEKRLDRRVRRRRRVQYELAAGLVHVKAALRDRRVIDLADAAGLGPLSRGLLQQSAAMQVSPMTLHNEVELLVDGAAKFPALFRAIARAQHHIHLMYYIFEADETGVKVRDALVERARAGVQVRILTDAVGSFSTRAGFFDELEAAGGRAESFMPARLAGRRFDVNFRNHRKVAVIDGLEGFIGGLNIANEYSGLIPSTPAWHDIHLRIDGPAVHYLQEAFVQDWFFSAGEDLASEHFFPLPRMNGKCPVQVVCSGPDEEWPTLHQLFFSAIATSERRVFFMTPYFVPTESLVSAMISAAHRDVDIRIVIPRKTDQALIDLAARSYFRELLLAGVKIFEFHERMLHAKVLTVDGRVGTVGTCNMDMRSFELNFEINAFVHSPSFTSELDAVIKAAIAVSRPITFEAFAARPYHRRLAENAARLLSPLL